MKEQRESRNEDEILENARNSLLAHYSSKSSNQTAIILSLAIVLLTFGQVYSALFKDVPPVLGIALWIMVLGMLGSIGIRAIRRLVYLGGLASALTRVEPMKSENVKMFLSVDKPELLKEQKEIQCLKWELSPTFMDRLFEPSSEYFRASLQDDRRKRELFLRFYKITDHKWFNYFYFAGVLAMLSLDVLVSIILQASITFWSTLSIAILFFLLYLLYYIILCGVSVEIKEPHDKDERIEKFRDRCRKIQEEEARQRTLGP